MLALFLLPGIANARVEACVSLDSLPSSNIDNERLILVSESIALCPQEEVIRGTRFKLKASNITLDCGGNTFDGTIPATTEKASRAVDSAAALEDVAIENCTFKNYQKGLLLTPATLGIGGANYATGLKRFRVKNVTIKDIGVYDANSPLGGEGLIVGPYSQDFLIDNVVVENTRLSGIYLEAYSVRTRVTNSSFIHNGFSGSASGREAIAIDASSENVIANNLFKDNKYAAIATYKNCGEAGVARNMHANDNLIERNTFSYHDNYNGGAAIVIAARQGAVLSGCSDDAMPGYGNRYFDFSKHNVVRENAFVNNIASIKVMDSFQTISGNTFHGTSWNDLSDPSVKHKMVYDVVIGNAQLAELGAPVIGVSILDNITRTSTTNTSGRTFVLNHDSTAAFTGNRDQNYGCLAEDKGPGNACAELETILPSNRCEVSVTACPAHPRGNWLDATYGSNVIQSTCAARARQLWDWCRLDGSGSYSVTTEFFKNNVFLEKTTYNGATR